jgi:AcrR family transcriptional regulator
MSRLPAEKRREQLLDCAADLFAKSGYARATTAELARAAGVTEPIIYRHFNSKRDLFIALVERTAKHTLSHWEQQLADASDPAERLRRVIGDNPMVSPEGAVGYRVLLQAITEVNDPEIQKAVGGHFRKLHEFLTRELKRAQDERKVMRVFPAELMAWTLIHVGLGYGVLVALGVQGHDEDSTGQKVQGMLERILVGRHEE